MHSFWVPQILYCIRTDSRQPLLGPFVIGMSLTRLALPLYLFGCPHNLVRVPPNYGLCCLLLLHMGAQVRTMHDRVAVASIEISICQGPCQRMPARQLMHKGDKISTCLSRISCAATGMMSQ